MSEPIEMKSGEQYYFASTDTYWAGEVYYHCGKCNLTRSTCTTSMSLVSSSCGAPAGAICSMCKGPARMWTLTEIMTDRLRTRLTLVP